MIVRCRTNSTHWHARLELLKGGARRRFVLWLQDPSGRRVAVGPIEAAIGYELIDGTAAEVAALTLAGFRLRRAGSECPPWRRLIGALRDARRKGRRATRRSKRLVPDLARAKSAATVPAPKAQVARPSHAANAAKGRSGHQNQHPSEGHVKEARHRGHRV